MARLNPQGLARKCEGLLSCILPEEKHVTVSIDLSAGEPTVTTEYSQDVRYRYATLDGVGKAPYYAPDGVLMIDDLYLMCMAVSPVGRQQMLDTFHNHQFPAGSFVDQWLTDAEVVKSYLKKSRQLHKMWALAHGYGCGPKRAVKQVYEAGYSVSMADAVAFHRAYWQLFGGVKKLAERLARQIELDGFLINQFGYRMTCVPRLAFNYFIQSSVSGIMHVFVAKLMAIAPYALFDTVIHDELVADVPIDRLEDFRAAAKAATDSLNADLGWSVKIRTGFVSGRSWFEAK